MSKKNLVLEKIVKRFETESERLTILDSLDLVVEEGTKVAIIGESGSGKSTLLNIIGGLESPTSGSVTAGIFNVDELDERLLSEYRREYLGLVFQFHYLLKDFTALENVMLPSLMAGSTRREARERAENLLHEVGLADRLTHYPAQLSGGERQRAAVARALVNNPSLVLADEPTGNLDPANAELVRELLFSVVSRHGKTLIIVTHDTMISDMADVRYRLEAGRLIQQ
ncbi:MAG: ABC transporter ATP-binding protein [Spirochaetales bacterium]|nr:ABC transporter ATP-binding protein [Spirochaetales bacterium]